MIPNDNQDTFALEAAQVFYSRNEFAIPIQEIPQFFAWDIGIYKPNNLTTHLTILFGPPQDPGGGNEELLPLLSMPTLQSIRLIFQDYEIKDLGPGACLKPSFLPFSIYEHILGRV
jgi:hypothetical protein